ncbi:DUF4340 domain-containing protein [Candidatus Sumerlaeota bacterium]|nr:DUF4340 domain-containing protein [Candidatus Sumerlaeales bacterium]NLD61989.1 DUF4340 domain-containing protein [Candidatus Sumerlaeota bacterium]
MKNLIVLAVIAALLVGAAWYMSKEEEKTIEQAAVPVRDVFGGSITSGTLTRIDISTPEDKAVSLHEKDGNWYVDDICTRKANQSLVNGVVRKLEGKIKGEVVATGNNLVDNYGLNESSATLIKLYKKDGHSEEWQLGKAGTSYMTTYVKKVGSDEILSADTNLKNVFDTKQTWRERSIWTLKPGDVTSVETRGTTSTYKLLVNGDTKSVEGRDTTMSLTKANDILNAVCNLASNDFVNDATTETLAQYALEPVQQEVIVTWQDKTTSNTTPVVNTLYLGKADGLRNLYYAKTPDSKDIYLIDGNSAKKMLVTIDDLAPLPAPPLPDPKPVAVQDQQTTPAL